ncbi:extracellular solute-binding protein [Paenibacillus polygoni]|uniref:Extracellular solute-binding protein n=1 Tax=Paenibacillus polygoni TaxID=3050112 RepID=A0ABY8X712_9BACL|nr:extracellular solute-binding protein [Paenibacillus polygoni]WIV21230.1 extracellular solute-binding protein [Paenibacillus polygoni]
MSNRKWLKMFILSVSMVTVLAGCGEAESTKVGASANWAAEQGLDKTETVDELYAKAKEEGKVVIYSQSSRIKDVKASFEAEYPGVTLEAFDMSTNEIVEKLVREYESKVFNADVVYVKDTLGVVSSDLVERGILHGYKPADILETLSPEFQDLPGIVTNATVRTVYYNTKAYKETPVTNWWQLTEPEWKTRVLINDPLESSDTMELFLSMIQHSDDMAAAYKELYGKDIELTEENAGYEFMARLLKNDPVLVKSSDDVVENVGTSSQEKPPIGIGASSKLRNIEQKELSISANFDMKPKISVLGPSYLYVVDQAKHTAGAKLLIRWMMGELGGEGEGLRPFNVLGSWPSNPSVSHKNPINLDQLNIWQYDGKYFYNNSIKFREFWIKNIK